MSDEINEDPKVENTGVKGLAMSLILKLGSGVIVLGVLGYAASWAFMTLNSLQEGVTKNTEKLEMIEKGVEKDREDKAQWKQIIVIREKTIDNEVEIRVLKELYEIQKSIPRQESYSQSIPKRTNERPEIFGPERPDKLDKLYDELIERKESKPESIDAFKEQCIQQMQQMEQSVSPK